MSSACKYVSGGISFKLFDLSFRFHISSGIESIFKSGPRIREIFSAVADKRMFKSITLIRLLDQNLYEYTCVIMFFKYLLSFISFIVILAYSLLF